MIYNFPRIENIKNVLPLIEGKKEFIVSEKDHFTTVNYVVMCEDTFPDAYNVNNRILRELRGLKFCNKSGAILARPFHKFFNLNEREETQLKNIDITKPHLILEKLDGSMIHPIYCDGEIRWCTKMGITEVSMNAEAFVAKHPKYNEYARTMLDSNMTPIFEWLSRENKIVLDYPEDNLILLAIRHNITGDYVHYDKLKESTSIAGIPLVICHKTNGKSLDKIIDIVRQEEDEEGIIVRFDGGQMYKVKSEWYCKLHRVKDIVNNERHLVKLIIEKDLDDAKSFMLEEDLKRVNKFEKKFNYHLKSLSKDILDEFVHAITETNGDRKIFAVDYSKNLSKPVKHIMFRLWDVKSLHENNVLVIVQEQIQKHLSKDVKYDIIKKEYNLPDLELR